jgi:hypothetical protein
MFACSNAAALGEICFAAGHENPFEQLDLFRIEIFRYSKYFVQFQGVFPPEGLTS